MDYPAARERLDILSSLGPIAYGGIKPHPIVFDAARGILAGLEREQAPCPLVRGDDNGNIQLSWGDGRFGVIVAALHSFDAAVCDAFPWGKPPRDVHPAVGKFFSEK